jgi:hypothetical protein
MELREGAVKNEETEFGLDESVLLNNEMSDEVLETAACLGPQNGRSFTIAMCTGQAECPF